MSRQISDLPVSLFHCHSLRHLGLSDNELQTLPPAVASLIHLHVLDVSKNGTSHNFCFCVGKGGRVIGAVPQFPPS